MRLLRSFYLCCMLAVVAFIVLVAPAYADETRVRIDQVRATEFPAITVRFTVSSARGAPVPLLSSKDFAVVDNGQVINDLNVYSLYQSPTPLAVVMAIDVSGSMNDEGKLVAAKSASKAFISQLRPVDEIEIISFSDKVTTVVPFTHDRAKLDRGIDSLAADGNTLLYDATDRAITDVLHQPGTRVAIVLTDGEDTASKATLAGALDLAKQTSVPIYTIGLGSDAADNVLTRMATESVGSYFKAPKAGDLTAIFSRLAQDVENQYELTYVSSAQALPGKTLSAAVRVLPAGFTPVDAAFTYVIPAAKVYQPVPVSPGVLQRVIEPMLPSATPQPTSTVTPPSRFSPENAGLFAFGAILALVAGVALGLTRDPVVARLATFVDPTARVLRRRDNDMASRHLIGSLIVGLASLATRVLPANQIQELRRKLVVAGNPRGMDVEHFLGLRMLLAIVLGATGWLYAPATGPMTTLLYAVAGGMLGFLLPAIWLGGKIRARQKAIFRAMPNALDLIAVTVEAGLGFDQAISEVCQKWQNELTREFSLFLSEVQMGRDRREAMRGIIERTGVPALNGFVGAIIQADELGTGIARTLTVQAEQVRIQRRQEAEKRAHEAAIKMVFPLVFLIFPAIFVVILGPAIPDIYRSLGNLGK